MRKLTPESRYDMNVIQDVIDKICSEGVLIDDKTTVELMLELEGKIESSNALAEQILNEKFDWDFINVKSPKQLSDFYTHWGYAKYGNPGKAGTNFPTECLEKIIELDDQMKEITQLFINIMADRYSLSAMESVRKHGQPTEADGISIVYPEYSQADSGRIHFTKPNLSNLGERKRMVVAGEGYKLISFDYKNQEPWIIANMLGLESVLKRMEAGEDYYRALAEEYCGITISDADRKPFKTSVIAIGYLCTLPTALNGIPDHLRQTVKDFYSVFTKLPEFVAFREKVQECFDGDRTMRTYFNTPWEVAHYRGMNYSTWERSAFNRPFQATGVDILFFALEGLEEIYKEIGGDIRTYITLHDEVVIRVKEELVTDELVEKLRNAVLFDVEGWTQLRVDTKILDTWLDK
ncbi:DNA polymerase [Paenibacillus pabuli]|uniref:DNA polymerase n=1 Tax=Paenibacillus pabuli TaxID=1472 RepID=UPI003242D36B